MNLLVLVEEGFFAFLLLRLNLSEFARFLMNMLFAIPLSAHLYLQPLFGFGLAIFRETPSKKARFSIQSPSCPRGVMLQHTTEISEREDERSRMRR